MESNFGEISKILPLLVPLLIIQLVLMVVAIVDLIRRPETRGPKWVWVLVILFVNMIGPIIYLVVGRKEES